MRGDGDWIKLHRSLLDSRVFSDADVLRVFLWCLLKANWQPSWYAGREIFPGSFVTGSSNAIAELNIGRQKWRDAIEKLKLWGMISVTTTNKFSIVSVVKYDDFQGQNGSAQPSNNQQGTNSQPSTNHPPTTIEEGEEGKKERNNKRRRSPEKLRIDSGEVIPSKLDATIFREAWGRWKAHYFELTGRQLGAQAANVTLMRMNRQGTVASHIEAIDYSIENNWKTIHAPDQKFKSGSKANVVPLAFPDAVEGEQ